MADKNTLHPADDDSNLMSFESPAAKPNCLVPERKGNQKSSPLLTVQKNASISNESPDMNVVVTPIDASTPFTENHVPKFVFPSPPNTIQEQVSDPFDFVEQRADQMANDPFEIVCAEAAKIIPASDMTLNISNLDENETADSLNKGFLDDNSGNKTKESVGSTQDSSSETANAPAIIIEPPIPPVKADSSGEEDLDNVSPPWEGTDFMSDSDYEDDLIEVVRNASMELMSSFTLSSAESLNDENIRQLELSFPGHVSCLLDDSSPLDLEVPPLSLDTSALSSPLFEISMNPASAPRTLHKDSPFELCGRMESKACQGKLLTPRISARPLEVITNSASISKIPARLASRLMQPRIFKNKENI